MDELADALGIDPVELRIRNEPAADPEIGLPFSSRNLVACLREGARALRLGRPRPAPGVRARRAAGWSAPASPPSTYPACTSAPSTATARGRADGQLRGRDRRHRHRHRRPYRADPGRRRRARRAAGPGRRSGSATATSARAVIAGGSMGTASWGWAVIKACRGAARARRDGRRSPPADGDARRTPTRRTIAARRRSSRGTRSARSSPRSGSTSTPARSGSPRLLGVFAAGRIVNPTTARSQFLGGMTMGLSHGAARGGAAGPPVRRLRQPRPRRVPHRRQRRRPRDRGALDRRAGRRTSTRSASRASARSASSAPPPRSPTPSTTRPVSGCATCRSGWTDFSPDPHEHLWRHTVQYMKLGRTGLDILRICLGCMSYGEPDRGTHPWTLDEEESRPFSGRA